MSTLTALEEVVQRHGRATLTDPMTLTGALRSLPDPPPEADINDLAAAVAAGVVPKLRTVREAGGTAAQARAEAVALARGALGDRAEQACDLLGGALGLLPRDLSEDPLENTSAPTEAVTTELAGAGAGPPVRPRRGRTALIAGAVLAVLALGGTGMTVALTSGDDQAEPTPQPPATTSAAPAPSGQAGGPVPTPTAQPGPEAAFTDRDVLAAARPYLGGAGVKCTAEDTSVSVRENVTCQLGSGVVASFRRLLKPEQLKALRSVLLNQNEGALPGSIRTLRWEYVPGKPGVRAGIPVGTPRTGNGTRIRFLDPEHSYARLYFDEDATGVAVYMQASTDDQQVLRAFWADPDA